MEWELLAGPRRGSRPRLAPPSWCALKLKGPTQRATTPSRPQDVPAHSRNGMHPPSGRTTGDHAPHRADESHARRRGRTATWATSEGGVGGEKWLRVGAGRDLDESLAERDHELRARVQARSSEGGVDLRLDRLVARCGHRCDPRWCDDRCCWCCGGRGRGRRLAALLAKFPSTDEGDTLRVVEAREPFVALVRSHDGGDHDSLGWSVSGSTPGNLAVQ